MQYFDLDTKEKQLLKDFETGKLKEIKNLKKAKKLYRQYANNTLQKTKSINIRINERDLYRLKSQAIKEGMPYQTLIASLLHKFSWSEQSFN